jgi:hypothetical protein
MPRTMTARTRPPTANTIAMDHSDARNGPVRGGLVDVDDRQGLLPVRGLGLHCGEQRGVLVGLAGGVDRCGRGLLNLAHVRAFFSSFWMRVARGWPMP